MAGGRWAAGQQAAAAAVPAAAAAAAAAETQPQQHRRVAAPETRPMVSAVSLTMEASGLGAQPGYASSCGGGGKASECAHCCWAVPRARQQAPLHQQSQLSALPPTRAAPAPPQRRTAGRCARCWTAPAVTRGGSGSSLSRARQVRRQVDSAQAPAPSCCHPGRPHTCSSGSIMLLRVEHCTAYTASLPAPAGCGLMEARLVEVSTRPAGQRQAGEASRTQQQEGPT